MLNQCDVCPLQSFLGRAPVIVFLPFACISRKCCQLDMPLVSLSPHNVCMYRQGERKWNPVSPFHLKAWNSGRLNEEQWIEGVIGTGTILWFPCSEELGSSPRPVSTDIKEKPPEHTSGADEELWRPERAERGLWCFLPEDEPGRPQHLKEAVKPQLTSILAFSASHQGKHRGKVVSQHPEHLALSRLPPSLPLKVNTP